MAADTSPTLAPCLPPDQPVLPHGHCRWPNKTRPVAVGINTYLGKLFRKEGGRRISIRTFEVHELGPVNGNVGCADPLAGHAMDSINDLRSTHQHLLGMTPT